LFQPRGGVHNQHMLTVPHAALAIDTIETPRLRLRAHRIEDFPACAAIWSDPAVVRHLAIPALTEEDTWNRMLRYAGHWATLGFGYWAIEEKVTGAFAGDLGFADYKRDMTPNIHGLPEMGWILAPAFHGKGYATEAALAALAWGKPRFAGKRAVCLIEPENQASIRVAGKIGFGERQLGRYKGRDVAFFVHDGR
jgi:RimJ/RimL family protein N-acetyltransferase